MNIMIFIPVRVNSSRLKKKPLLDIEGKKIIEHIIERMKITKAPNGIVVCTTRNPDDDEIVTICKNQGVQCFRGCENDIIKRYLKAIKEYNVDFLINVDGDDLLCNPYYVDKTAKYFIENGGEVFKWSSVPLGVAPIGIKSNCIEKIYEIKKEKEIDTGWGRYITESNIFDVKTLKPQKDSIPNDIRMTLDYEEDYDFFKEVFKNLYKPGKIITHYELLTFLKNNPEVININKKINEKYWKRFNELSPDI